MVSFSFPLFPFIDLLSHLESMENLISELTRCMAIIEKNRDSNRFRYIDNVFYLSLWSVLGRDGAA